MQRARSRLRPMRRSSSTPPRRGAHCETPPILIPGCCGSSGYSPDPPGPHVYRSLLFVHRWSSIVAAAFLIVAGVTGSAIAFRAEIERALNADTLRVVPRGAVIDVDALAQRVARRYPDAWIGGVIPAGDPRDAWIFTLTKPGARAGGYSP